MMHFVPGAVSIIILLGLTWVFAFFTISEAAIVFHYLFAIFNSLQGLWIFIFYCFLKHDVQNMWMKCLPCCPSPKESTSSSKGKNASKCDMPV